MNEQSEQPTQIEQVRRREGLSRAELARLSGVSYNTIRSWERRERRPRDVYLLTMLANILDCTVEELIEKEGVIDYDKLRSKNDQK